MLYGSGLIDDTFHIDVELSYEHLDWKTTYMIESTDGITYNTAGANENVAQEQLYMSKNMDRNSSKHYAVFDIPIDLELSNYHYDISYFKLQAGNNLWWHKDYYSFFQDKFNIRDRKAGSIHRTIINLNDWSHGQIFQCDRHYAVEWKKGDCYTFPEDVGHGVGNFSTEDYVIMQVTWIKKNNINRI
jgi:hypothetical protein|tara:strand:+ start:209 stop:769 length:561 start_codon:yes stop_codon:yes gene_type:complete